MRIVLTIIFLTVYFCAAGKPIFLKIIVVDETKENKKYISYKNRLPDSLSVLMELRKVVSTLHAEAYIAAGIDTVYFSSDTASAYLMVGDRHLWAELRRGNVSEDILNRVEYKERFYRNKEFRYHEIVKIEDNIVKYMENNGYPFASIVLDSIEIYQNTMKAALKLRKGPLVFFDSLTIEGKTRTKKRFLIRHLRIYKGDLYDQSRVDATNKLVRDLPYLSTTRPPVMVFSKNKAYMTLFMEDRKVNNLDGIIGFLPNAGSNKKLLITGEINLGLKNLFGTGKVLSVQWKKIQEASQTLDLSYLHPKFLGSNIDVKVLFDLYKQDSSFLTVNRALILSHRVGNNGKVSLNTGLKTSRILSAPVITADSTKLQYSDFDYYTYGLGYDWNNLNDIFYPKKGWLFSTQGYVGSKEIKKTPSVSDAYYTNVKLNSVQFNLDIRAEKYFTLGRNSVLQAKATFGKLFNNSNNLFYNDLYRIGGLKTLRGFNENNFFASTYAITTLEYRFFTDETSYLLLFYDQGYYENQLNPVTPRDFPLGFGAGVSFSTPAGQFYFIYSLGNSKDQHISLNQSKLHFGLTSRF